MPHPHQAVRTPCSAFCSASLSLSVLFPLMFALHPESGPASQNAQTTEAAGSPVSPRRHPRAICLFSTPPRPPARAVQKDPSDSGP